MINRQNYLDAHAYLRYLIDTRQVQENTKFAIQSRLKHLLIWADETPFTNFHKIKPTFQKHLESVKKDDGSLLGASYLTATFKTARNFLFWAKREWPTRFKGLDYSHIEAMKPTRVRSEAAVLKKREIYTIEDMRKIIAVEPETLAEQRIIAGTAFLFLSGMRVTAFLSLPIKAVNTDEWSVSQLPELGVQTKNSKAAITYLLPIPELLEVVSTWDSFIRSRVPDTANWYTVLDPNGDLSSKKRNTVNGRVHIRKELIKLCDKAGIPYLSSHKFRHGHAVYALKKADNMAQWKAISQNLMHSNTGITDSVYGQLVSNDQKSIIHGL